VKRILIPVAAILFMSVSTASQAYEAWACGDRIWGGLRNAVTFQIDRCDTPDGSAEDQAIDFAMQSWNSIFGVFDRFRSTDGDNNCVITSADGRFELGVVPNNDPLLDGNDGVASIWTGDDCGRLTGASVVTRETAPMGALEELDSREGGRSVLIHELGHVLGSSNTHPTLGGGHENDEMSIMNVPNSVGKVGRRSGSPTSSSYGGRSETVMPDDVQFAVRFHASTNAGSIDAIVSPWSFSSGRPVLNYSGTNRFLCPGDRTTVQFSYGNIGKLPITSANPVSLDVYVSSNDFISTSDTQATSGGSFTAGLGWFGTATWTFTVPSLSAGTYFVGMIADKDGNHAEDDERNNAMETGLRITIRSTC